MSTRFCSILTAVNDDDNDLINEDMGEESDIASEDEEEERMSETKTDQEADTDVSDEEQDSGNNVILGKDKITKWKDTPPMRNVRRAPHNIVTKLPGVIGNAKLAKSPVECWNNLFTDEMLDDIVRFTNQYITSIKNLYSRERDISTTDVIEVRAFIGLLYLAGAYRSNRQSLEELWGSEGDGIEKFGLVMNIKRFKTLFRSLRFDDRDSRLDRKAEDRLAPIRELFEQFVKNFKKCYSLGTNVTIDEMLPGFRGRCPFRQYIPSKPNKYGIKIFALVNAKMMYSYNLEIYPGKQPEGGFSQSNNPADVVKRLAEPLFGSGRNITADNHFTDLNLARELMKKKLSYVGTVRKNKRELPLSFVATKGRKQNTSIFGFNEGLTIVSYVPKPQKNVIFLSNLHNDKAIDLDSGELNKPEIITFYNSTKGGVDSVDKMCSTFNVGRNVKRWPMVIFFSILNIGGINSQVIYFGNGSEPMKRRLFLKQLSHELVLGELQRRSMKSIGIPLNLQQRLKRYPFPDAESEPSPGPSKKQRCVTCTDETGKRRLSKHVCKKCKSSIYLSHANFVCDICFSALPSVTPVREED